MRIVVLVALFASCSPAPREQLGHELSAEVIYEQFVRNQLVDGFVRHYVATDSVNMERLQFWVRNEAPGKVLLRVVGPKSSRGVMHLVSVLTGRAEQHRYDPVERRVELVDVCARIAESDLSACDFAPWPEDAAVVRLDDVEIDGKAVYALDVRLRESPWPYPLRTLYVTPRRFVALEIRFRDEHGTERRRWTADPDSIEDRLPGHSEPTVWAIRTLATGSETRLVVERAVDPRTDPRPWEAYPWCRENPGICDKELER